MKPNRPRFFTIPRSCDAPEQTATNAASGHNRPVACSLKRPFDWLLYSETRLIAYGRTSA